MIERHEYLNKLFAFKDKQIIKIVSGIRRCGKSTLFKLYQNELKKNGIADSQIISVNLEDLTYENLLDYRALHDYIRARLIPDKMNYVFLDEIQNVPSFEKMADSLFIQENVDLYLTGSNAYMLSGELATLLSGRYVQIEMLPLSFAEYTQAFSDNHNIDRLFQAYLANSSFPYTLQLNDSSAITDYLSGIYNTIVLKDVIARKKIADVSVLENLIKFMFDNIGNLTSAKKISDTMTSGGRKITPPTVENYLSALTESYILYRASRYDIKGKQFLKSLDKYYLCDTAFRSLLIGGNQADSGHILENVVYLELLRRGFKVFVGQNDGKEIDFVAVKAPGTIAYYQVSETVRDETTLRRELAPLETVSDHNPKFLLTRDIDPPQNLNGIQKLNVLDWLLNKV